MTTELLTEAHTQRSSVPLSLEPASPPLEQTYNFSKVYETIEKLDSLRIPSPSSVRTLADLSFEGQDVVNVPDVGRLHMTDWAQRRIGGMMGVKWRKFFAPMDPEQVQDAIHAHIYGLGTECPAIKLVSRELLSSEGMSTDGILRGVVSPSYGEFRDLHALDHLYEAGGSLLDTEWAFQSIRLLDNGSHFDLIHTHPFELIPGSGDMGYVGMHLLNSEVGAHSYTASLRVLRLVCVNGMMVPLEESRFFRFVHKGTLVDRVSDSIEQALNRCYELVEEVPKLNETLFNYKLDDPQAHLSEAFRRYGVNSVMQEAVQQYYDETEDIEGDNAYRALQAFTRLSPALRQDPTRQQTMERVASKYAEDIIKEARK